MLDRTVRALHHRHDAPLHVPRHGMPVDVVPAAGEELEHDRFRAVPASGAADGSAARLARRPPPTGPRGLWRSRAGAAAARPVRRGAAAAGRAERRTQLFDLRVRD